MGTRWLQLRKVNTSISKSSKHMTSCVAIGWQLKTHQIWFPILLVPPTVSRRCKEVNINYAKHFLCWVWSSSIAGRPESRCYPKLTFFQNSCWLSCRGQQNERTKTWSKFIITTHANIYRYRCRKELTGIHSLGPWGTLSIWSVPFVRASNSMCVLRVYLSVLTAEEICLVPYPRIGGSSFV